jgi:hypothetical protein
MLEGRKSGKIKVEEVAMPSSPRHFSASDVATDEANLCLLRLKI